MRSNMLFTLWCCVLLSGCTELSTTITSELSGTLSHVDGYISSTEGDVLVYDVETQTDTLKVVIGKAVETRPGTVTRSQISPMIYLSGPDQMRPGFSYVTTPLLPMLLSDSVINSSWTRSTSYLVDSVSVTMETYPYSRLFSRSNPVHVWYEVFYDRTSDTRVNGYVEAYDTTLTIDGEQIKVDRYHLKQESNSGEWYNTWVADVIRDSIVKQVEFTRMPVELSFPTFLQYRRRVIHRRTE